MFGEERNLTTSSHWFVDISLKAGNPLKLYCVIMFGRVDCYADLYYQRYNLH